MRQRYGGILALAVEICDFERNYQGSFQGEIMLNKKQVKK
jgi:hypothetical protein